MYYQEGMTQKEIATLLARSVNGVEKRLKRLREQKLVAV
ncbi:sigma factor-like helix-turn-helix DNA-binding protein [Bacillus thuringiensis]|nr:sigma factor-like helix-turn-helix DNA-binding protein [Bacillus thuringiensis]